MGYPKAAHTGLYSLLIVVFASYRSSKFWTFSCLLSSFFLLSFFQINSNFPRFGAPGRHPLMRGYYTTPFALCARLKEPRTLNLISQTIYDI